MKNKVKFYIVGFLVIFLIFWINAWLYFLFTPAILQSTGYIFDLPQGASANHVINLLTQQKIIRYPRFFSLYVYFQKNDHVKTGEYFFPKGSTPISIWWQITNGRGLYLHPFTVVPGWTFSQLRRGLLHTQGLRYTIGTLSDEQIMQRLGALVVSPEGEFFPDTYFYTKGNADFVILIRSFNSMQQHLKEAWDKRMTDLPYRNSYEALIAASLIEKEAYLSNERSIIAGVLVNRIKKEMLLQFDPTVIYGLGENYNGTIHKADLLKDTAYNTYLHKGLPPTPIAMPSLASISAALHPVQHDYYYFVAKGDGSHQFSKTLLEHYEAVKAISKNGGSHDAREIY